MRWGRSSLAFPGETSLTSSHASQDVPSLCEQVLFPPVLTSLYQTRAQGRSVPKGAARPGELCGDGSGGGKGRQALPASCPPRTAFLWQPKIHHLCVSLELVALALALLTPVSLLASKEPHIQAKLGGMDRE